MKINKKSVLKVCLVTLLGYPPLIYAKDKEQKCTSDIILLVADKLKLEGIEEGDTSKNSWLIAGLEGVKAAACKINPQDKNLMYVTFASNPTDSNGYGESTYDFTIAVVDIKKQSVISSYKSKLEEDAMLRVEDGMLWIDTANYRLNEKTRAFGIDFTSAYIPHCGDGGVGAVRTLYIQEGKIIRPILEGLYMSNWAYLVEGNSRCNSLVDESIVAIIKEDHKSISIADTVTNGFKDIIISNSSIITDGDGKERSKEEKVVKENLPKNESLKPYSYKIQYNGKEYPNK